MPSKIGTHRTCAAQNQQWLCFYCHLPMSGDGSPYAKLLSIVGHQFSTTAEHLRALQDGGCDCRANIVAAHAICNRRRHRRVAPLDPDAFKNLVQRRVVGRQWFDARQFKILKSALEMGPGLHAAAAPRAQLKILSRTGENPCGYCSMAMKEGAKPTNHKMRGTTSSIERGNITVHGCRSTSRDWATEQTSSGGYRLDMCCESQRASGL